jgi:hypothetical protein
MEFPKPPKTENKAHTVIKRTAIVRRPDWKPLRRSCAEARSETGEANTFRALLQATACD